MAYTPPTSADIIARYPAFAAVSPGLIEMIITEVGGWADATWPEGPRRLLVQYLTAHTLAVENAAGGGFGGATAGPISSSKVTAAGEIAVTYAKAAVASASGSDRSGLDQTPYGLDAKRLLRLYLGGPRIV